MRSKYEKYNVETWKNKSEKVLVQRDKKGHFIHWELFYSYRCSRGITGVPIHSTRQKPNYYGFTIFAYATKIEFLNELSEKLKEKLKDLVKKYINNLVKNNYSWELLTNNWVSTYVGWEPPTRIVIDKNLLNTWEFIAENNGKQVYSETGNIEEL